MDAILSHGQIAGLEAARINGVDARCGELPDGLLTVLLTEGSCRAIVPPNVEREPQQRWIQRLHRVADADVDQRGADKARAINPQLVFAAPDVAATFIAAKRRDVI